MHFEIIFEKKNPNAFNFKPNKRTVETSFKVHVGSTPKPLLEKRHLFHFVRNCKQCVTGFPSNNEDKF